jgi:hypothetical protein
MISSRCSSRLWFLNLDDDHTLSPSSHCLYEIFLCMQAHGTISSIIPSSSMIIMSWRYTRLLTQLYYSKHNCNKIKSHMTILQIIPWITHWSSLDLLHFILLTTLKQTYGSSIVSFNYKSMQTLVCMNCYYLPRPHMGAPCSSNLPLSPLDDQRWCDNNHKKDGMGH